MSQIILREKPELKRPILIVAFAGWNDAGHAATIAVQQLNAAWSAAEFATIDPDLFYDFNTSRPWVRLEESGEQRLTWPGVSFHAHRDEKGGLDAILVVGSEPSFRWPSFSREIVEFARELDVSMVVTLGAYFGQVSHQDTVPISGWAWPKALHERLQEVEITPIGYEGPTGILSALSNAFAEAQIPVASLWAAVPNYLGPTPNPKAALALVRRLDRAFGLGVSADDLVKAADQFERQVNHAVQQAKLMPGAAPYQQSEGDATRLAETKEDIGPGSTPTELPSAEEAIEFAEELLRNNRPG